MINNELTNSDVSKKTQTKRPSLTPEMQSKVGRFKERLKLITDGKSLRGFGRKAGISEGALRHYLNGDSFPDLDRLAAIAEIAEVDLMWLATGEGDPKEARKENSNACAGGIDALALARALQLVELIQSSASPEQKAKAAAVAYDLLADPAQPLDVGRIQRLLEPLLKGI